MKGINIMEIIWMIYEGKVEYKCKSTIEFGLQQSRQRGSMLETLLMKMMMMKTDAWPYKMQVSSSSWVVWWWRSCVWWLWRQRSGKDLPLRCGWTLPLVLGFPLFK